MAAGDRRLAAILFADMVGYSALAQRDEPLALRLVDETAGLVRRTFAPHRGRVVKAMGDGFLVEFDTALEATEGAVALQRALFERNQRPDTPPVEMRVGIHLGDVVHDDGDVLGDAVNIAARIEPLAEASGICLSEPVFQLVRAKLSFTATKLEHAFLKNIETPIAVYSLDLPWHAPPAARLTPWTNRADELAAIREAIDEVRKGHAWIVGLSGEPGIGKSRLAEEAIAHALRSTFRVLRGRGFEDTQHAPYALWAEAIRSWVREAPTQLLYKASEDCASELLALLPELTARLGRAPPAASGDPESARLRFLSGLTRFFQNLAKEMPLLLLLDDLQWADSGSLSMLSYLGSHVEGERLLVLLTYRDAEVGETGALRNAVESLRRVRPFRELRLDRFDAETTRALVSAMLPSGEVANDLVAPMIDRTGGNPYFVEELLRSLVEEGTLVRAGSGWELKAGAALEIPATVRDVVRRRVERVGSEAADLLSAASVFGGEFDFGLLARVVGLDEDRLLPVIEQLLRARLLHEREAAPGNSVLRFGDDQIRRVLYEDLSGLRRRKYHARAAEELERALGTDAGNRAGELAYQFLRAGRGARALDYLELAAERAAQVYAREQAIMHYRTALSVDELASNPHRRFDILRRLGDQEAMLDHIDLAVGAWREAAEGLEKNGDRKAAADLFGSIANRYRKYYDRPDLALEALERARSLVAGESESPEAARFYLTAAGFYLWGGEVPPARAMAERALEVAARFEIRGTEVDAHELLADLASVSERERVFGHLHQAREIVERFGLGNEAIYVYASLGGATLLMNGDAPDAIRWQSKAIEAARKMGNLSAEMGSRNLMAFARVRLGDLATARTLMEELFDHTSRRHPRPMPQLICTLGEVSVLLGDEKRASEVLNLWLSYRTESVAPFCRQRTANVLARWYMTRGDFPRAIESLERARELYRKNGTPAVRAALGAETLALLVEASLESQDSGRAKAALDELRNLVSELNASVGFGYLHRSEGLWMATGGDRSSAARAFERSVQAWTTIGWCYEQARTLLDLGSLHARAKDSERARPALERALDLFDTMGARPDADRTRGLIASLDA